ncbi:MAG: adenosylcobinamide-GDP ribazoletransferase [Dehalococcoidales bacterium]|nr:adenosylcobinamide-GDP ribazoletransferase [Dehalococcoidales bacterium]
MGFWIALQFLTVIPSPFHRRPEPRQLAASLSYFPVIGIVIGAVLFLVNWGLAALFSPTVSAALTLAVWVLISGALHLDGLIDCCDGLAGGTPAQRLKIMADSRVGAYGIVGVCIILLIKYAAIVSLPATWKLEALLLVPMLGVWAMVFALFAFPYVRKEGLGRHFKVGANGYRFALVTLLTLAAAIGLARWQGVIVMAITGLIALGMGYFFKVRLGGLTGDVYGAIKEVSEAIILALFPVIVNLG